jgi:hypothetical protein
MKRRSVFIGMFLSVSIIFISTGCNLFSSNSNTYCIIENRTINDISIIKLDGFVQNHDKKDMKPNETFKFESSISSIGENLDLVVSIDNISYLASSGYVQDYSYIKIVLLENNIYEVYSPDNQLLNNGGSKLSIY